uniref:Uncharacterized protein n=1 Tax=Rhizophora mucronata TaxID=61149 RepID=A0A2P2QYZ7_RHIMU
MLFTLCNNLFCYVMEMNGNSTS